MPWTIDDSLRVPANEEVLAFLERTQPSAHDEIASALLSAAEGQRGFRKYCPDPLAYAWYALHTNNHVIFALALGMNAVLFRLPPDLIEEALGQGGEAATEVGTGWIRWRLGWSLDLRPWCGAALGFAS